MNRDNTLRFMELSCVISTDGLKAVIKQEGLSPVLKDYKEKYKLGGIMVGGKSYAERCYEYDMERWLAVREVLGKEYEIERFSSPITTNYEGKIFKCIILGNGKVNIL